MQCAPEPAVRVPIASALLPVEQTFGDEMNPYTVLSSHIGTAEATSLAARLADWHDDMVAHERRLRIRSTSEKCDEECPHVQASVLWAEAEALFGGRATALSFLRSRAAAHMSRQPSGIDTTSDADLLTA